MKGIYLSLGSNHGDRHRNVEEGLIWLQDILLESRSSSIYVTKAVQGYGPAYYNAVVFGQTPMEYDEFNRLLKEYEINCGRSPESRKRNEVIIDIDIVVWDGKIVRPTDFSRDFFQIGYGEIN